MKRTKKTTEQQQLKLDTQTVKELTTTDFGLVNGGTLVADGRNTCTCRKQ